MLTGRSKSGRYYLWSQLVEQARQAQPRWVRLLPDTPASVVVSVQQRRHPDLRLPDGRLEAKVLHKARDENGVERGDVYLRFLPDPPQ